MTRISASAVFLCVLASISSAVAAPAPGLAEVIPGPGLPSLEELGTTTRELHARGLPSAAEMNELTARFEAENGLSKRFNAFCAGDGRVNRDNAISCYNYLRNLGTRACVVNGENVTFCQAGDAFIDGSNISGGGSASSYCSDVALGALWVINNCNVNNAVQGAQAANGNGGLVVSIERYGA